MGKKRKDGTPPKTERELLNESLAPDPEPAPKPVRKVPVLRWETVQNYSWREDAHPNMPVFRARVHGGWLVTMDKKSLATVPDPKHEWAPELVDQEEVTRLREKGPQEVVSE